MQSTKSTSGPLPISPDIIAKVVTGVQRLLLILDFTIVSNIIALVPVLGRPASLLYMSVIDAYYAFDSTFAAKRWSLDRKVEYMQHRAAYMMGFGLPATLMTSFGPHLVTMAVFALISPFVGNIISARSGIDEQMVIQALLARPPIPNDSLLPGTPSPHTSAPPSPDSAMHPALISPSLTSPVDSLRSASWFQNTSGGRQGTVRVPMFVMARQAITGLHWLQDAIMRDRTVGRSGGGMQISQRDRTGKRQR